MGNSPDTNTGLLLAVKAVNGGLFVVTFALVVEGLTPKRFAGLFSAARSVVLAKVLVTVLDKGRPWKRTSRSTSKASVGALFLRGNRGAARPLARRHPRKGSKARGL